MTRRSFWSDTAAAIRDGRVADTIAEALEGLFGGPRPQPIPVRVVRQGQHGRDGRRT